MAREDWVDDVVKFWFEELEPSDWYSADKDLDQRIRERFSALYARQREALSADRVDDPSTALAAVILFDQFPRNMFRGMAEAFASDDLAIDISRRALEKELDRAMNETEKSFLYMPLMHSEILADQERCVDLFRGLDNEEGLKYAIEHRDIIAEYGRFPHRNRVLGRESTRAEMEFLARHPGYGQ
jgi:uncharacterized protein (DUF924 family)